MEVVYFVIRLPAIKHPCKGAVLELRLKETLKKNYGFIEI